MSRLLRVRLCVITVIAVFAADVLLTAVFYVYAKNQFIYNESHSVDVCVVLNGGFGGMHGLDAETIRRLNYALNLFGSGRFKSFICAGGARHKKDLYGSESMKQYLIQKGIDKDLIEAETKSNDTFSNLLEAQNIIEKNNFKSALIVSSPLHFVRIRHFNKDKDYMVDRYLNAYNPEAIMPKVSLPELWKQVHYEWTAYFLIWVLPSSCYESLIGLIR